MWTDLMIDLETMGLPPTGAIAGLGACFFDVQKGEIGPTFYRAVNLATSVKAGMTIDAGTVIWWLGQSQEARDAIRFSASALTTVLEEFAAFIVEHSRRQDVRPWGNSSSFDLTILGAAYKMAEIDQPWYFTNERCFRTVRNMYPQVEYNPDDKGLDAHNARADAIFQAQHLIKIKNRKRTPA